MITSADVPEPKPEPNHRPSPEYLPQVALTTLRRSL